MQAVCYAFYGFFGNVAIDFLDLLEDGDEGPFLVGGLFNYFINPGKVKFLDRHQAPLEIGKSTAVLIITVIMGGKDNIEV